MLGNLFGKKSSITILPNPTLCPDGQIIKAKEGKSLAETLVDNDIEIGHSCQYQCSCTTCLINLMEGQGFVASMSEEEREILSKAKLLSKWSRLSCQCVFKGGGDVVIEIVE